MTTNSTARAAPITVRKVLRLFWEADHYPILGNADARDAFELDRQARAQAAWVASVLRVRLEIKVERLEVGSTPAFVLSRLSGDGAGLPKISIAYHRS